MAGIALPLALTLAASISTSVFYSHIISTSMLHNPTAIILPPPPAVDELPPAKDALESMEKIGYGKLPGPEDIAVDKQGMFLYTSSSDGWIRRISLEHGRVENWTYVGGRPLGIAVGLSNEILVCEPELGLLNVTENHVKVLSSEADGLKYKLADGVAVAGDGSIYFTDATTAYTLHYFDQDMLEGRPYGRLLKYDPHTKETTVLLNNLYFANGVALSENEDFLVFSETARARIQRYWLRGEKKGTAEIFSDNLPGLPDNIHRFGNKFWVALLGGRSWYWEKALRFSFIQHLFARKRVLVHYLDNSYARVMAMDEDGKAVQMYESPQSKSIHFLTGAMQYGDFLYVGSLSSKYMGKIRIY